jgi:hypothetical protein
MPVRKIISQVNDNDHVIEPVVERGLVGISIHNLSDPLGECAPTAYIVIDPDDVPALCTELRRVAKLAKQGGGNG